MALSETPTQTANKALDLVPSANIASMAEASHGARTVLKHYAAAVGELLELCNWSGSRKRVTLAALVNNDRTGTIWGYAFTLPADCALIVRLLPAYDPAIGVTEGYFPLEGQTPASGMDSEASAGVSYDVAGSTLYAREPTPVLEYISTTLTRTSALFLKALASRLASKIVMPITKDKARHRELEALAAYDAQIAAAQDIAQVPRTYGDFVPQEVMNRLGYDPTGGF